MAQKVHRICLFATRQGFEKPNEDDEANGKGTHRIS